MNKTKLTIHIVVAVVAAILGGLAIYDGMTSLANSYYYEPEIAGSMVVLTALFSAVIVYCVFNIHHYSIIKVWKDIVNAQKDDITSQVKILNIDNKLIAEYKELRTILRSKSALQKTVINKQIESIAYYKTKLDTSQKDFETVSDKCETAIRQRDVALFKITNLEKQLTKNIDTPTV